MEPEVKADLVGSRYMHVTGDSPNPWTQRIGQGKNTPLWEPEILTIEKDGIVDVTNSTAISLGDNVSIIVNGLVHARNNSGGGTYGTGANVVETNSNTSIIVNLGGSIIKEGTQNQAEAINVHGFANQIMNYGTIRASNSAAIWFQDVDYGGGGAAQRNIVDNYGLIERVGGGNVIGTSGGNGIIFSNQTGATVVGNLSFAQGNDDLYFYANSSVTGSIDGGRGENRLFLAGASGSSDELTNPLRNFQTITKTGEGQWTISGSISGTETPLRSVRVEQGTLRLTGNNSNFTGDLSINTNEDGSVGTHPDAVLEARVQSLPTNSTGNTENIKNYGTLRFVNDDTGTYVGQIVGTGKVEMIGSGTVVLVPQVGSNTYSGGTYVKNGTLGISADSALGAVSGPLVLGDGSNIGTLQFQGNFNLDPGRSIRLIGGGGAFDTNGFNTTISQTFAAPSDNLYKKGAGTLTLIGDSSLLGSTYIQEGTLQLGGGGTTGSVGGVYVDISSGAALAYNHSDNVTDPTVIIGAGRVIQRGTGTLELTGQYTNTTTPFTGGTEIETGTILISDKNAYNKTTGAANNAGHFLYAAKTDGDTLTIQVDPSVDSLQNHFHVTTPNTITSKNVFQITGNLTISDVTNNSPTQNLGGAFYVGPGSKLDINVGQTGQSGIDLKFENNKYGSTGNDFYLGSYSSLNLNVSGADGTSNGNAVFINGGISGQGNLFVDGPGLVQISADSQVAQTTVTKSTIRLTDGMRYVGPIYTQDSQSSLQGTGTIDASIGGGNGITIAGKLSPDKAKFSTGSDTVAAADRVGTLSLVGDTTTLNGFTYEYDVMAANTVKDPLQTKNDLVQFGTQTVRIADGTIDFRTEKLSDGKHAALETGRYLLFDSPGATYVDGSGTSLTQADLNGGVFTTLVNGNGFIYPSPRRSLQYEFDNDTGMPPNSQIWLDYLVNSLTMDWTGGSTTNNPIGGNWNSTSEMWNSQQSVTGNLHERVFMAGDKVHFYIQGAGTVYEVNLTEDATVSGMVAGRSSSGTTSNGNVTISGVGGITSDAASAFGIYLPGESGSPTLTPTGKLEKFGAGTLTISNTGTNNFFDGIDLYTGKITLRGPGNRLGTYGNVTGHANAGLVTFVNDGIAGSQRILEIAGQNQTLHNKFVVSNDLANNSIIAAGVNATIKNADGVTGDAVVLGVGSSLTVGGTGNVIVQSRMTGAAGSTLTKMNAGTLQIETDSNADHTVVNDGIFRVTKGVTFGSATTSSFNVVRDGQAGTNSQAFVAGAGTVKANQIDIRGHISPDNLNVTDATAGSRYDTLTFETVGAGSTITMSGFSLNFDVTGPTYINGLPNPDTFHTDLLVLNGTVVGNDTTGFGGTVNFITETGGLARGDYRVIVSSNGFNLGSIAHADLDGILNPNGALKAKLNGNDASDLVGSPRGTMQFEYRTDGTTGTVTDNEIWLVVTSNSLTMDWFGGGSVGDPDSGDWTYSWDVMRSAQVVAGSRYAFQFMDGDKVHVSNPNTTGSKSTITVTLEAPGPRPMNVTVSGLVVGKTSGGENGDAGAVVQNGNVTIDGSGSITSYADSAFGDYLFGNSNPQSTPVLTPTGKLEKFGTGTLSIKNTGGNRFLEGTDLNNGKIVIGNQKALDETNAFGTLNGHVRFTGNAGDTRTIEVADTVGSIKNHFRTLSGTSNTFNNLGNLTISGVTNYNAVAGNTLGGAFYVASGTGLTIDADGDLTLSGNSHNTTPPYLPSTRVANDIYVAGGNLTFDVAAGKGVFVNSGLSGSGTVNVGSGLVGSSGFVQIAAASDFTGSTHVKNGGTFRVIQGVTYADTGTFNVNGGTLGGTLAGGGTVKADTLAINGIISPDKAIFSTGNTTLTDTNKYGKLTLQGNGATSVTTLGVDAASRFVFNYDAKEANTTTDKDTTPNDLLSILGMNMIMLNSGTINISPSGTYLETGKYLIVDADQQISVAGGQTNANLNNQVKGRIDGQSFESLSPRVGYQFRFNDRANGTNEASDPFHQIWLDAELNSLTMDWTPGVNSTIWNTTASNFTSLQKSATGVVSEKVFRNGDKVHFFGSGDDTVELGSDVLVSGMVGGRNSSGTDRTGNVTISGDYGITARLPKATGETDIIGKYVGNTLAETGKLEKYGSGTLTFTNTGGNLFTEGIEIAAGTVGFNRADQLAVGSGKVIEFTSTGNNDAAMLRADETTYLDTAILVDTPAHGWLHADADKAMLVRSTISGNGTLRKSGEGIVQLSTVNSTAFAGMTIIEEGTFRVVDGVIFGDVDSANFHLTSAADTDATLAGGGTIKAKISTIGDGIKANSRAIISPDKAALTADNAIVSATDKFGTLTLDGHGTSEGNITFSSAVNADYPTKNTRDGFWFDYDVNAPNTSVTDTTNDLIQIVGMNSVRLEGGVVNFRTGADGLGSGSYLIIDSNVMITDGSGDQFRTKDNLGAPGDWLDGINDYATNEGVLWGKINGEDIRTGSPRRELEFVLRESDKQIWLDVQRNTLTMVRVLTADDDWNTTDASQSWVSEQENTLTGEKEHVIERGDYARIYNPTAGTSFNVTLRADQIVSGLELGGDSGTSTYGAGDFVINGDYGITAKTTDDWIEGFYIDPQTGQPQVPVDGKLRKTGNNTATFANTGDNSFEKGIDIAAGTLSFKRADQLQVGVGAAITFTGAATDNATLRADETTNLDTDVIVAADKTGSLNAGSGVSMLVNKTISGSGTLKKTGPGTVQLNAISTAFTGAASVDQGIFRVVDNVSFGSATSTLNVTRTATDFGTIAGAGTFNGQSITVNGNISPDKLVDLVDGSQTGSDIGTLTLQADTITLDGFAMDYDTVAPNIDISGNGSNNPTATQNDLLSLIGTSTVTGGTINFRGAFSSGDYLIADSNTTIGTDGKPIDGIDDPTGVLKATYNGNAITNDTPRGTYQFELRDFTAENSQIWYTVERNTLTMDRTVGGAFSDSNFVSRQVEPPGTSGNPANGFQHGDAAFLTNNGTAYTVDVDMLDSTKNATVVSHFEVDGNGDITLTGNGILATTTYAGIEGKFLEGGTGSPTVPVDGKYVKRGDGTFTFRNAANTFEEGVFLYGGTTAFNKANQLGDGGKGINFTGDATLRADTSTLIYNTINISDDKTATLETADENAVWTCAGEVIGGPSSALDKTGAGTLDLRRAPNENQHVAFSGKATVTGGTLGVYADYRDVSQFTVKSGATLTGSGILGATTDGGVIESGGTLAPRGYTSGNPAVTHLTVNGNLTFDAGSNFDVTISQNPNDIDADGKMAPVSDYVKVENGMVSIDGAAKLNVEFDYWNGALTINDFNEEQSSKFTVIDATGGRAEDEEAQFTLNPSKVLPRGVKLAQGWQNYENGWLNFGEGWLYQLWFESDPDNNFENLCNRHNRIEIGKNLDKLTLATDSGLKDLIMHLSARCFSDQEVCQLLDQLTGDLRANSLMMAMKTPWRSPFSRLDEGSSTGCVDPCSPIVRKPHKLQLWGEWTARYDDVRSDRNAHPYTINRMGVTVGADRRISHRTSLGLAFNYSDPRLRQATGKAEMDDYEIGFYGRTRLNSDWMLKYYAGYSHQRYDLTRNVYIPACEQDGFAALNERFRNKTDGDSLAMSVELIRALRIRENFRLLPTLAFDFNHAWQKGYQESGGLTALEYQKTSLERMMMRFGLGSEYAVRNNINLRARIQYATQLNSHEQPRSLTRFANATIADQRYAEIWGTRIGRDYLNLGIGVDWKLNRKRSLSLFVNYDVDLYNRATIHAGEAGVLRQW